MQLNPIGTVHTIVKEKTDQGWGAVQSDIIIRPDLKDGLTGLAQFSHIIVVTYLHEAEFIPERHLVRRTSANRVDQSQQNTGVRKRGEKLGIDHGAYGVCMAVCPYTQRYVKSCDGNDAI